MIDSIEKTLQLLQSPFTRSPILWALVKKDLKDKYASSLLGMLWTFLRPLATVFIYAFFFTMIYHSRVPSEYGNAPFIIFLLLGFTPFTVFGEVIGRSPSMLSMNISMITKMVFPYELFSVSSFISALFGAAVNLCMIVVFAIAYGVDVSWANLVYAPLFFVPLVGYTIGLSWILSCIGVIIRDTEQVVNIFLTLLIFITPVFFSHEMVEGLIRDVPFLGYFLLLNPLYTIVEGLRSSVIGNELRLGWRLILYCYVVSTAVFVGGAALFERFKRHVADYL
jgi:lipopolysaccharide transport system permease protein